LTGLRILAEVRFRDRASTTFAYFWPDLPRSGRRAGFFQPTGIVSLLWLCQEKALTASTLNNSDGTPYFDPNATAASGVSQGPSAAASALMSILTFLNSQSVSYAIQSGFNALKPTLDSSISSWAADNETGMCYEDSLVGCVVQSVLYRLDGPIGSSPTFSFVGVYACNCGLDYQTALNETLRQGSYLPGGPDGSTMVCNYLWYKQE
jgi:hypothetical protein